MPTNLAKRLEAVAPSATLAMTAKAAELRAKGRKVYAFGVGEPDFETPEHIRLAAQAAMGKSSHYTAVQGTASLREAICVATERDRGWRPTPDAVTVSVGAKHALFNLAMVLEELGAAGEARPHWEAFLRLDPEGPWAEVARKHLER